MSKTPRRLAVPDGYDVATNPRVASFAAQLDDQLRRLEKDVADLETRHLEWQIHPGTNTAGMLLAHLAVVDLWWMVIAPRGKMPGPETDATMQEVIGIAMNDDGLPIPKDGTHPASLAGRTLQDYLSMLDRARAATHASLRAWKDSTLHEGYELGDRQISWEWTAYHVLEHFAGHYGQILMLKHFMRDAGVLEERERE